MPAAMDDANGSAAGRDIKDEHNDSDDGRTGDGKATYKSWKKKYRKMRITFDQKMHDCENLHRQESKALATAKRIAIENDRILDLLLDMNSSAQIPLDKRVDLALDPPEDAPFPSLDLDKEDKSEELGQPTKALKTLLTDVPHLTFSQAKDNSPSVVADMEPFSGEPHPPSFLTTDDLDDYLHEVDKRIDPDHLLPTLAPSARTATSLPETNPHALSQSIAMKNPTSVYNWLRKHAPKTFLQDAENAAAAGDDDNTPGNAVETPHHTDGRRRRGGARGEGSRGGRGSRGGKRASLAASRAEKAAERAAEKAALAAERAAAMREAADKYHEDDDDDESYAVVTPATGRGKRKRAAARDDDDGYRPKGSSSRPVKKKRKSESADVGTPTVSKRGRKSEASRDRDD